MDTVVKIASLAIIGAILCVLVRENQKSLAILLSMTLCGLLLFLALRFFTPILTVVDQLRELSGLNNTVTAPLIKVVGIGILVQLAGGVCEDAGEGALKTAVQIGGTVLSLYAALPLMTAVLDLLKQMLEG